MGTFLAGSTGEQSSSRHYTPSAATEGRPSASLFLLPNLNRRLCCTTCRPLQLVASAASTVSVTVDCTCGHDTGHVLWLCWPTGQEGGLARASKFVVHDLEGHKGWEHDAWDEQDNVTTLTVYFTFWMQIKICIYYFTREFVSNHYN